MLKLCCWTLSLPQRLQTCPFFKDSLYWYCYLFSEWTFKIFLTEDWSSWPCSPKPTNVVPPLRSPERPCRPHTTSQRQNGPNYHFRLSLLYTDKSPAPCYENPTQVFKIGQQTLSMEGQQPSHYIFYQIILRQIWINLSQEVHIRHLPNLLSQSLCLFFT